MLKLTNLLIFMLIMAGVVSADVPQVINYQGKLTDNVGNPLTGSYQITFRIYYILEEGGDMEWIETHPVVEVTDGLFSVELGSINPIPDNCFAENIEASLGITVGTDPEIEPHSKLISVPFAFHALRADTADYVAGSSNSSGWVDEAEVVHLIDDQDTVKIGNYDGGAKLNVKGEPSGADGTFTTGLAVSADNMSNSETISGYFSATSEAGHAKGVKAVSYTTGSDTAYGLNGMATNYGSGAAVGIYGLTDFEGTGDKIGVLGRGNGAGAGNNYGGHFTTAGGMSNTGDKFGVYALANNLTSSTAYGVYGVAYNPNDGYVKGGFFTTSGNGTGPRIGVHSVADADNNVNAIGLRASARNQGSGQVYGGYFSTDYEGTGDKKAIYGTTSVFGAEEGYGLDIYTFGDGSGTTYGINSQSDGSSTGSVYGISILSQNYTTATSVYGGYHTAKGTSGSGVFGLVGNAYNKGGMFTWGVTGLAVDSGSGATIAGYFNAISAGYGTHYGVQAYEAAGGSGAAIYASGDFAASGTKSAVVRTSKGATLMYAVESAEVWFEDFGEGSLNNGRTDIELDPDFLETVTIDNDHSMKVFIQLNDDCMGTFVKTYSTSFTVFELQNGKSNASFTYRVVAKRIGYEDERMRPTDIGEDDPHLYPERADEILKKMESIQQNNEK